MIQKVLGFVCAAVVLGIGVFADQCHQRVRQKAGDAISDAFSPKPPARSVPAAAPVPSSQELFVQVMDLQYDVNELSGKDRELMLAKADQLVRIARTVDREYLRSLEPGLPNAFESLILFHMAYPAAVRRSDAIEQMRAVSDYKVFQDYWTAHRDAIGAKVGR